MRPISDNTSVSGANWILKLLLATSFVLVGFSLWMIFLWVPTEINQGAVQRALYVHVPVAWVSMLSIVIVAFSSTLYLITKQEKWDRLALASAEVGVVSAALMLITGMIYGKSMWGVYWTGEAKLTTAMILFFIYVAYLMFRSYFPPGSQRQRLSAIIAILGAVDTPIIYYAAQLWEQNHPAAVIGPLATNDSSVDGSIGLTLMVSAVAFTVLCSYLVVERYRLRQTEDDVLTLQRSINNKQIAS